MPPATQLTRRERQIMDVLYAHGRLSARDIRDAIDGAPSYSAVRALLAVLETKGHVRHVEEGPRYLYLPVVPQRRARASALTQLVRTYFNGSASAAAAALISECATTLSAAELDDLARQIDAARAAGR